METKCDYEGCKRDMVATEGLTGMKGKLCEVHLRKLFGKIMDNAEIIDEKGRRIG